MPELPGSPVFATDDRDRRYVTGATSPIDGDTTLGIGTRRAVFDIDLSDRTHSNAIRSVEPSVTGGYNGNRRHVTIAVGRKNSHAVG